MGILALQGDYAEHAAALAELGVDSRPVRRPEELAGIDGLVFPGGESTTMSMLLESSGLAEPLGKELAGGLPVMGTCAGMILLATQVTDGRKDQRFYGAIDIAVRRNGYGRQQESFECDLDVADLGERPLHAVFIRAPVVEAVGEGVEVLARTAAESGRSDREGVGVRAAGGDTPSPVICRQGPVLVTAFHPELTRDLRLHELFLSMIGTTERDK
ncbi:MAG: pyridoxal 5'-phosphate synthase glutaminase subunit PdxT [Acidimicrobiales bacterium]